MPIRNITKQLAGEEDLLLGEGTVEQERNGKPVIIKKIDMPVMVATIDDLSDIDITKHKTAMVRDINRGGTFHYDASKITMLDYGVTFNGWVRDFDGPIQLLWFDAPTDGITSASTEIARALAYITSVGSGELIFDAKGGTFAIDDSVHPSSNTILTFKSYIKMIAETGYDCAIHIGRLNNTTDTYYNIVINNPLIELNYIPAEGGIILRRDASNIRVNGGLIIHGRHEAAAQYGGRGINIEAGNSDGRPRNITITGTNIIDCYMGISVSGNDDSRNNTSAITNLTIEKCEVMIGIVGNGVGFPHNGQSSSYVISNIIGKNCGTSTTYPARTNGIISCNRGSNVQLSNIFCYNDSTTGTVGAIFKGNMSNINASNICVYGDVDAILSTDNWAEVNGTPADNEVFKTVNCVFKDIRVVGSCAETIESNTSLDYKLTNTILEAYVDSVTSGTIISNQFINRPSLYVKIYEKLNNSIIEGFAEKLGTGIVFADYANSSYSATGINVSENLIIQNYAPGLTLQDRTTNAHSYRLRANEDKLVVSHNDGTWKNLYYTNYERLAPYATETMEIGSNTLRWDTGYFKNIDAENHIVKGTSYHMKTSMNGNDMDFSYSVDDGAAWTSILQLRYNKLISTGDNRDDLGRPGNEFRGIYSRGYFANGLTGVSGTFANPTSITVTGGIITAIS